MDKIINHSIESCIINITFLYLTSSYFSNNYHRLKTKTFQEYFYFEYLLKFLSEIFSDFFKTVFIEHYKYKEKRFNHHHFLNCTPNLFCSFFFEEFCTPNLNP